jgi:RepB DNA-primase from phage plasmid
MIPACYKALAKDRSNSVAKEAAIAFVTSLWAGYSASAYTFIGTRRGDTWRDHPINGNRRREIETVFAEHPTDRYDLYFCPSAFEQAQRRTEYALPSRYAWCDIDDADPKGYDPAANILWETSPGRHQGLWLWRSSVKPGIAEAYSRGLWQKCGGDKGGWSITKMLRVPGTINHKPLYDRPTVRLRTFDDRPQRVPRWLAKIDPPSVPSAPAAIIIDGLDPQVIMRRYRRAVGLEVGSLMMANRIMRGDRSGAVFRIVAGLIDAGASDAEIAAVLLVNPYFTSKWGTDLTNAEHQIARIRLRVEQNI